MQRNSLFVLALVPHRRTQISLVKTAATVRHAMQTWLVMIYVDGVYAIFIATQTHHKRFSRIFCFQLFIRQLAPTTKKATCNTIYMHLKDSPCRRRRLHLYRIVNGVVVVVLMSSKSYNCKKIAQFQPLDFK